MPFNRRMDKQNVVHIHNGVLRSRENNDIMKFAGKWMELENVILSEVIVATDINTDSSCSRTMYPDLTLSSSLDQDKAVGSTSHSDQDGSGGSMVPRYQQGHRKVVSQIQLYAKLALDLEWALFFSKHKLLLKEKIMSPAHIFMSMIVLTELYLVCEHT
ncbi:hypothetical protein STEG23_000413 [Scotinomys teguina]